MTHSLTAQACELDTSGLHFSMAARAAAHAPLSQPAWRQACAGQAPLQRPHKHVAWASSTAQLRGKRLGAAQARPQQQRMLATHNVPRRQTLVTTVVLGSATVSHIFDSCRSVSFQFNSKDPPTKHLGSGHPASRRLGRCYELPARRCGSCTLMETASSCVQKDASSTTSDWCDPALRAPSVWAAMRADSGVMRIALFLAHGLVACSLMQAHLQHRES